MAILALNAGSSSLKFALYGSGGGDLTPIVRGAVEGIGATAGVFRIRREDGTDLSEAIPMRTDHRAAFQRALSACEKSGDLEVKGIGHRVVHGGTQFSGPVVIDGSVLGELKRLIPFAPLHQPAQVTLIEAVAAEYPSTPQVACFDTAIHHTLPEVAARFPLPRWLWDEGVRRYGFHGLSYEFVLSTDAEFRRGKTIIAHLGHGASITAFREGVSVETTMGFTPTGGLMMGTRCGDLDPGVLLYLLREHSCSVEDLDRIVNVESGLLGVSGRTSDLKQLLGRPQDEDAALAVDMFCYQAAMRIGGLAAALSGVDRLVFTGGIGERSAVVRDAICDRLSFLRLSLDQSRNKAGDPVISAEASRCGVHIVQTDEERVIARHTRDILGTGAGPLTE